MNDSVPTHCAGERRDQLNRYVSLHDASSLTTLRTANLSWLSIGFVLSGIALLVAGCATSMTPSQFNDRLPKETASKFHDRIEASRAISTGQCRLLVGGRKYASPMGLTVSGDLKNGALGIDEWVKADGGNAYSVSNFEWISVGDEGGAQLTVYFDTLRCE